MNLPDVNPGGYINASISNVTGFHDVNYLLAHGSGDDNVHFSNSAHLLDMLTREKVRNFRFRMFTDRYVVILYLDILLTPHVVIIAYTGGVHSGRFMSTLLHFW